MTLESQIAALKVQISQIEQSSLDDDTKESKIEILESRIENLEAKQKKLESEKSDEASNTKAPPPPPPPTDEEEDEDEVSNVTYSSDASSTANDTGSVVYYA